MLSATKVFCVRAKSCNVSRYFGTPRVEIVGCLVGVLRRQWLTVV